MYKILFLAFCIVGVAHAEPSKTMTPIDTALLDAAITHVNLNTAQGERDKQAIDARTAAANAPYIESAKVICTHYMIDFMQVGKDVLVNPTTGAITRRPKAATK